MPFAHQVAATVLAVSLGACSGRDFTRPTDGEFVTGTTTRDEILSRMGKPRVATQATANGEPIAALSHVYGEGLLVRAITFLLHDDVLVGREFTSSFPDDHTSFDVDKARSVQPGMSRAAVEAVLGNAPGEYRYPLTSARTTTALVYKFSQPGDKFRRWMLVAEIDGQGSVQRVEFEELVVPMMVERPNRMEFLWSDDHRRWVAYTPIFNAGWARLTKGLSPVDVEALLGPGHCHVGFRVSGQFEQFDQLTFSQLTIPDRELSRDCLLEFDSSGLARWSLHPPLSLGRLP